MFATACLGSFAQAKTEFGTTSEILGIIGNVANTKTLTLPLDDGSDALLAVEEFRWDDDELLVAGQVVGFPDAQFLIRGTTAHLHGWVYFRAQKLAYEYDTNRDGLVSVEQVPTRKVCPSCDSVAPPRPVMTLANAPTIAAITANPTANEPHIGSYNGADLLNLQSRPSATKILYMNISGILDGSGAPSSATAGNGKAWTKAEIYQVWQTAAAAYSAFDVNVTTSPTVFAATASKNAGIAKFVAQNDTSACYMDGFGSTTWICTIYATKPCETESIGFGRTVAHEFGHLLGMNDAGTTTGDAYYTGNATYKWYPMMGNYYYASDTTNAVVQWSKGEWTNANPEAKIDGLASIDKYLDYRADDITSPREMTISGTSVTADSNRGQITGATDSDDFTFTIGSSGGSVNLTIDRIEFIGGAMLDVLATLKNSSGTTLVSSNPTAVRKATISQSSLGAGTYTLTIQGGYEGTAANGFTAYGSIGFYGIEGTITGATTTSTGTGGSTGAGGATSTGGATNAGGASTGGKANTGGTVTVNAGGASTGGKANTGGVVSTGGSSTGGKANTGGVVSTGGSNTGGSSTGGNSTATGGSGNPTGGSSAATGGSATGGSTGSATGGSVSVGVGGASSGGTTGSSTTAVGGATATMTETPVSGQEASCSCSVPGARQRSRAWLALGMLPLVLLRRRRRVG